MLLDVNSSMEMYGTQYLCVSFAIAITECEPSLKMGNSGSSAMKLNSARKA